MQESWKQGSKVSDMTSPPHWAFATHKGGVGKTALLTLMAAAAAEIGHRVLVVDMDPQANATRRLRAALPEDVNERMAASLAGVLQRPRRGGAGSILTPCGWGGIYTERITVAPGHLELELLALTAGSASSERRLLTALADVVDPFDVVMIDCPPNLLSHLIDNAWTAADLLFVPVEPEYDSVEAARRVAQRVEADKDTLNPDLQVAGYIVNRYRSTLSLHQQRALEVASIDGSDSLCPIRVPELVAFKNSSEKAAPLSEFGSQGADMAALAGEVYAWMRLRTEHLMGAVA
jgi:chromosome partitioning protein